MILISILFHISLSYARISVAISFAAKWIFICEFAFAAFPFENVNVNVELLTVDNTRDFITIKR